MPKEDLPDFSDESDTSIRKAVPSNSAESNHKSQQTRSSEPLRRRRSCDTLSKQYATCDRIRGPQDSLLFQSTEMSY